ncbi:MAG: glycosyl transferase family 2, partial [Ignavibacteriales bacterium]|nr:glycosyl transferase family 2 [Ignavibacteriales bacterium]
MIFDEIVLITYIVSLTVLFVFGSHGFIMIYYHRKYLKNEPKPLESFVPEKKVTIQLPLFNELYVSDRLIDAVCEIDYPKELLEIQVLDDSTDETVQVVAKKVKEKQDLGFDIVHF